MLRAAHLAALLALPGLAGAQTCALERASLDSGGLEADLASSQPALTPDGRYVAFLSSATNLVPGDANGFQDVFLRDRFLGTTERVSVGLGGAECDGGCGYPAISADGRYVAFQSTATNLVAGDTNNQTDVFVRDRLLGTTERVSVGPGGAQGDGPSFAPTITPDGRFVVFASFATSLVVGDTNFQRDVFLHDRQTHVTERVSVATGGGEGDGLSGGNGLLSWASGDGRYVAFASWAANLVPGDLNGALDVFLRDRALGTTVRAVLGLGGLEPDADVDLSAFTPDARYLGLVANATNLVAGDANGTGDAFVLDRTLGSLERVSVATGGTEGTLTSFGPVLTPDGRYAVFPSIAPDLVPSDTNDKRDLFRRDRLAGTTERFVFNESGSEIGDDAYAPALDALGGRVAFVSAAVGLLLSDMNGVADVFLRDCTPGIAYCTGTAAACPCGNGGAWDAGCANSTGPGAALGAQGHALTSADTLTLVARGAPSGSPTLFFQGSAPLAGAPFGDGLRCVGGSVQRLGIRPATGGVAAYGFGVPGSPLLSVQGGVPAGGDWRWYQAWYRNAASFCTPATFNLTNGFEVLWGM